MTSVGAWALGAVGLGAITALTSREPLLRAHPAVRLLATLAWSLSAGVLVWRLTADGLDMPSAAATVGCLSLLIVLVTWGRPALVMDRLFVETADDGPRMPQPLRRRSRLGQWTVIGAVITLAASQVLW